VIVPAGIGFNKFITIAILVAVLFFTGNTRINRCRDQRFVSVGKPNRLLL
jgi:hypothetical protein